MKDIYIYLGKHELDIKDFKKDDDITLNNKRFKVKGLTNDLLTLIPIYEKPLKKYKMLNDMNGNIVEFYSICDPYWVDINNSNNTDTTKINQNARKLMHRHINTAEEWKKLIYL